MSEPFDPLQGGIILKCLVNGPANGLLVDLLFDTGATDCTLSDHVMAYIGYSDADIIGRNAVGMASGPANLPVIPVRSLTAMGHSVSGLPVQRYTLYPGLQIEGVIGMSFVRGGVVTIDCEQFTISFQPPTSPATLP